MIDIPVDKFGDNQSVLANTTNHVSTLQKKSNSAAFRHWAITIVSGLLRYKLGHNPRNAKKQKPPNYFIR